MFGRYCSETVAADSSKPRSFKLCEKKHECKGSIGVNKAHFLQPMFPLSCAANSDSRALATFRTFGKYENKENPFELNVYFVRILIRFYTYSNNSQSL